MSSRGLPVVGSGIHTTHIDGRSGLAYTKRGRWNVIGTESFMIADHTIPSSFSA